MRFASLAPVTLLVGAFGAALSGCPVWSEDGTTSTSGYHPRPDSGIVSGGCSTSADCTFNQYCNAPTGECVTSQSCGANGLCPGGYYCDARSTCVPGCTTTNDCTALGAALVCDTASRRCVQGNRCTTDATCPSGSACVSGSCRATSTLCQFDYQCAGDQNCVDGRCLTTCRSGTVGANDCPTGLVCASGHCDYPATTTTTTGGTSGDAGTTTVTPASCACAATEVCVSGACVRPCNADSECGTGSFCDNGACRVDDRRPAPFCTNDSGCRSGSACVSGVCRIACPTGTDAECLNRDGSNFPICGTATSNGATVRICESTNEQMPQCQRNAQCATGQQCVNATCR